MDPSVEISGLRIGRHFLGRRQPGRQSVDATMLHPSITHGLMQVASQSAWVAADSPDDPDHPPQATSKPHEHLGLGLNRRPCHTHDCFLVSRPAGTPSLAWSRLTLAADCSRKCAVSPLALSSSSPDNQEPKTDELILALRFPPALKRASRLEQPAPTWNPPVDTPLARPV